MELDLTGIHIEVTEAIREFTEKKVEKLAKFFDPETICHVTFTEKNKGKQHVDIRIEYKSHTYLAEGEFDDIYSGLDDLIEKIEGQLRKEKAINQKKRREDLPNGEVQDIESILEDEE